jgi:ATP-binding cassette, subfamily C, bacterial LapB
MTFLGEKLRVRRGVEADQSLDFEAWHARAVQSDELLHTVEQIAEIFERPFAESRIKKGLALDEAGYLPIDQLDHALESVGLRHEIVDRPLVAWKAHDVPAILLLDSGRPLVLKALEGRDCTVRLPGAPNDIQIDRKYLEAAYSGQGIIVRHNPATEMVRERPWESVRKSHWFWSEVWKERDQYGYVMLASLFINILAFALPLFTMNVYDRIIPNKAATSLWVLALGALFAIAVEYSMRLARTGLIDEVGRSIDARLSQRLLDKVLNLPLATQRGSTGALARRVTEYEQVRDFFASTTVVLITDILFLFVFVALIAFLGGWLAVIPFVAMGIMLAAGWVLQKRMSTG